MKTIFGVILRVTLLVAGMVFVASLMLAALLLLAVWLVRALWAKLTGRAVSPWTFQVNRQAMWNRFYHPSGPASRADSEAGSGRSPLRNDADVIDVEPRDVKQVKD